MAGLYLRFANDYPRADRGAEAAKAMFEHESKGTKKPGDDNAFMLGKKWMDVTVAAWREDIRDGLLSRAELEADGYPNWFLNRVC